VVSNQYQSNRSVAAKAGQMQIFNNDIHTKFPPTSTNLGGGNQAIITS
jgi:hypothetical protein